MPNGTVAVRFVGDIQNLTSAVGDAESGLGRFAEGAALAGAAVATAVAGIGAALYGIGSSFDDSFDSIRVTTGETGESLAGLEQSFRDVVRNVPADFSDASDAIATLNQRLDLTGTPLEDLSTQVLNLSRITGTDLNTNVTAAADVFANWGIAAGDQAGRLDLLFRASQESGIAVGDLATQMADSGVVLRDVGLSFDESAAFIGTLGKAGVDAAEVMPALQRAMATAASQGRDSGQVFQWAFEQISNAPDQTAAASVAMEVFGTRAGPRLAAMIREGTLGYEDMLGAISGGGDTINAAAEDTADFGEKWQIIKNRVLLALEPVATAVFGAVGDAMDRIGPVVTEVAGGFQALFAAFQAGDGDVTSSGFAGHMEELGNVLRRVWDVASVVLPQIMEAVQTAISTVVGWFQQGGDSSTALGEKVSAVAGVFQSAFEAVQVVVSTIVTVLTDLWRRFGDDLIQFVRDAWDAVVQVFSGVIGILTGIFDLIKAILTGKWGEAWDAIKTILSGAWDAINGILDAAFAVVRGIFEAALGVLSAAWSLIWNGIKTIASDIWGGIVGVISGGLDLVVGFITGLPGRIAGAVGDAFSAIPRAFRAAINALIDIWNNFSITFPGYDIPGPGPNIPGFTIDTPNIPHLATGALVSSPMLALIGENPGTTPEIVSPVATMRGVVRDELATLVDVLVAELQGIRAEQLTMPKFRQALRAG